MVATLRQFRWGAAQAGISLSLASSAWLLSGLTSSPLINSLLPALTTLPALLSLQRRANGYALDPIPLQRLEGTGKRHTQWIMALM